MTTPDDAQRPVDLWQHPPTRARAWAHRCAASAAVCLVVVSYVRAGLDDTTPQGHPWLAASALSLAGFFLVQNRLWRGDRSTRIAAVLLPLAAVGFGIVMLLAR